MFRYILSLVIVASTMNSCVGQKSSLKKSDKNSVMEISGNFLITKIDSTTGYYFVYGSKNQAFYKIISKKESNQNDMKTIKLGETYFFNLNNFIKPNSDNPLTGFSSTDPCFFLDDKTEICREEGVLGIYVTENLKGITYQK
ncbi:MAG: hypothetical protein ACOH1N_12135 [Lutibacter sp.]